jgi:hypothetical protein
VTKDKIEGFMFGLAAGFVVSHFLSAHRDEGRPATRVLRKIEGRADKVEKRVFRPLDNFRTLSPNAVRR